MIESWYLVGPNQKLRQVLTECLVHKKSNTKIGIFADLKEFSSHIATHDAECVHWLKNWPRVDNVKSGLIIIRRDIQGIRLALIVPNSQSIFFSADHRRSPLPEKFFEIPPSNSTGENLINVARLVIGWLLKSDSRAGLERSLKKNNAIEVILIGASTGGPEALRTVLLDFAKLGIKVPIVVAIHLPNGFVSSLVQTLSHGTGFMCKEAVDSERLEPATAYFAPGRMHIEIAKDSHGPIIQLKEVSPEYMFTPSVNRLFTTAARHLAQQTIAIVLTGMGDDGTEGAGMLATAGSKVFIQDEASSTVWGMPKSVLKSGAVCEEVALTNIGLLTKDYIGRHKREIKS